LEKGMAGGLKRVLRGNGRGYGRGSERDA